MKKVSKAKLHPKPRFSSPRRWQRLPLSIPLFVRGTDHKGQKFLEFASAIDISAGGCLVAIRRYLPPGAVVTLEIPCVALPSNHPVASHIRNLRAKLVRVTNSAEYHLLGLEFAKPIVDGASRRAKAASAG